MMPSLRSLPLPLETTHLRKVTEYDVPLIPKTTAWGKEKWSLCSAAQHATLFAWPYEMHEGADSLLLNARVRIPYSLAQVADQSVRDHCGVYEEDDCVHTSQ